MTTTHLSPAVQAALARPPERVGRSKELYALDERRYLVRLRPTLDSFTYARHEDVPGTAEIRLDFFERAVERLATAGVRSAFLERVGPDLYVAERCSDPPFEVIVKQFAYGSTLRKYPGLFEEGQRFAAPVVKFDFRTSPEDQPIAADYLREHGDDPEELHALARVAFDTLAAWLTPRTLVDVCFVFGRDALGRYRCTSEVSPDCMRLRAPDGTPLDKDLFRQGATHEAIQEAWRGLVESLS